MVWGETCRWAAILSDAAFVSVVYITVKIPWVQRLSQYLEGQWDYPSQIRILLYLTRFCIWRQVRYPLYGPWHRASAARVPRQVLPQGAKTRVRGFANIQNFALRAHCVHGIPWEQARQGAWQGGSSPCGKHFASGTSRVKNHFPLAKTSVLVFHNFSDGC